jgi:hypothetical protein
MANVDNSGSTKQYMPIGEAASRENITTIGDMANWLADLKWEAPWPSPNAEKEFPTIKTLLNDLSAITLSKDDIELLLWPPDVFAICASILRASAGYLKLANQWPPGRERMAQLFPETKVSQTTPRQSIRNEGSISLKYRDSITSIATEWRRVVNGASLFLGNLDDDIGAGDRASRLRMKQLQIARVHPIDMDSVEKQKAFEGRIPDVIRHWWRILKKLSGFQISFIGLPKDSAEFGDHESILREQDPRRRDEYTDHANEIALLAAQVLQLLIAAADESSREVGIHHENVEGYMIQTAHKLVCRSNFELPATLCRRVYSRKAIVLPKMRTPQTGMNLRSLTHHLCHLYGSEAKPTWSFVNMPEPVAEGRKTSVQLLLIPYPKRIVPSQFAPHQVKAENEHAAGDKRILSDERYAFFEYSTEKGSDEHLVVHAISLLNEARSQFGQIDRIILPELSASDIVLNNLAHAVAALDEAQGKAGDFRVHFIIGGAKELPDPRSEGMPKNAALIYVRCTKEDNNGDNYSSSNPRWLRLRQSKHHRWHLGSQQLVQYALGGILDPSKTWVERIYLPRRSIDLVVLAQRMTMATLVCEDLAQADPIGEVLRSVGPNLVIALLADGPQILSRWPARYATVLADDPGSSVLTITSAGMVDASVPVPGSGAQAKARRIVAHWRDRETGSVELELPAQDDAIVLALNMKRVVELTSDGRFDAIEGRSNADGGTLLVYGGSKSIRNSSVPQRSPASVHTVPEFAEPQRVLAEALMATMKKISQTQNDLESFQYKYLKYFELIQ